MKRRDFLKFLTGALAATGAVALVYPVVRLIAPLSGEGTVQPIRIPKGDIPTGGTKDVVFQSTPVIVINREGAGYIALSRVCTHLGCLVQYSSKEGLLICPCHAGRFDLNGNVISGPPPSALRQFPVKVEGDHILIG
jgi:cytochrome b6-f complex iron-sulfur subunit